MRNKEKTTTNLMFLCKSKVNIPENSLVALPESKIEIKTTDENISILKNGEVMKTKIVDFKSIYADMVAGLSTIDFWTDEFLKDIAENNYCSNLSLSNAISVNGTSGYVLEAVVSFPRESEFYVKWNKERTRKGELFMRSLSNI